MAKKKLKMMTISSDMPNIKLEISEEDRILSDVELAVFMTGLEQNQRSRDEDSSLRIEWYTKQELKKS